MLNHLIQELITKAKDKKEADIIFEKIRQLSEEDLYAQELEEDDD